jgi:hypothetical protein
MSLHLILQEHFDQVRFERVIYTRKGWNVDGKEDIRKLNQLKCAANNILLEKGIVNDIDQIKYCPAHWQRRLTTQPQWCVAING